MSSRPRQFSTWLRQSSTWPGTEAAEVEQKAENLPNWRCALEKEAEQGLLDTEESHLEAEH